MIEVKELLVDFGETRAVDRVSFSVAAGEAFGIVGESGSGKSTVLRALSGLNRDWSGSMTIEGVPQGPVRARRFHRRLQMVFQDPYASLHPRQTVDRARSARSGSGPSTVSAIRISSRAVSASGSRSRAC